MSGRDDGGAGRAAGRDAGGFGTGEILTGIRSALHESAIMGFDRDGRYLFLWSDPALAERYGIDLAELEGRSLADLFPPEVAAERVERARRIFAEGGHHREVYAADFPRGRFYHDIRLAPMRDGDGRVVAVIGVLVDITDRVRAEEEARCSERLYRSVVEQVRDSIVIHRDGVVLYANPEAHRALGLAAGEMVGRPVAEFVHPDSRELVARRIAEALETGATLPLVEEKFVGADGALYFGETISCVVDYDGAPAVLAVIRDITDRKRTERERMRLEAKLLHAQKQESLSVLAGGVAHDFNNLLMAVLGNAALGRREAAPGSPLAARLDNIEVAARRASELTRQLRAYTGAESVDRERVDLGELVGEMLDLLTASISRKVSLVFARPEREVAVMADATQLRQAVMNLVVNAAEAIGEESGRIRIEVGVARVAPGDLERAVIGEELPAGEHAALTVRDDGCGIEPDVLERIFDPFFSTKFVGRGLGLAAVFGVVRGHGGALLVDSAPGRGSEFRLLFPFGGEARGSISSAPGPGPTAAVRGPVLVADDEEGVLGVVEQSLERAGFEVAVTRDGLETLAGFEERQDEWVAAVLDLAMPRLDGREVLAGLRRRRPELPVVLISGFSEGEIAERLAELRPDALIHKPFHPDDLVDTLDRLLARGRGGDGG